MADLVNYTRFGKDIIELAKDMARDEWKPDLVLGINRGGLIPSVYLSHWFDVDHKAIEADETAESLNEICKEYNKILLVDEICDTGKTFKGLMMRMPIKSVKTACLVYNAGQDVYLVNYIGTEVNKSEDPAWIVFPWE